VKRALYSVKRALFIAKRAAKETAAGGDITMTKRESMCKNPYMSYIVSCGKSPIYHEKSPMYCQKSRTKEKAAGGHVAMTHL